MNLRGGSEFAKEIYFKAGTQTGCLCIFEFFYSVAVSGRCMTPVVVVVVSLGELFPLWGQDAALRPVTWTFLRCELVATRESLTQVLRSAVASEVAGGAAL